MDNTTSLELKKTRQAIIDDNETLLATAEKEERVMSDEEDSRFNANLQQAEEMAKQITETEQREYHAEKRNLIAKQQQDNAKPIRKVNPGVYPSGIQTASKRTNKTFNQAFKGWLKGGSKCTLEENRCADEWEIDVRNERLTLNPPTKQGIEQRIGLDESSTAAGEALFTTTLFMQIAEAQKAFGGLAAKATMVTTEDGRPLQIPDVDYTTFVATATTNSTLGTSFAPFGTKTLNAWLYRTQIVPITMELIEDSAFDIQQYAGKMIGMALARGEAADLVTGAGSGSSAARGITLDASQTVTGASLSYSVLLNIIASLDPAYWPNSSWLMSEKTYINLAQMVDDNNRPLVFNQLQALPNSPFAANLLGFPIVIDQAMPYSTASNPANSVILFGDLSYFYIRKIQGSLQLIRYVETYRAQYDAIGLQANERIDSCLVNVGSNGPVVAFGATGSSAE
jgi:HK97 family phage major capsid protein